MGCGYDTAGSVPRVEPHYGWMMVFCARCGKGVVTARRPEAISWWRNLRRYRDAILVLAFQFAAAGLILGVLPLACVALHVSLANSGMDAYSRLVAGGADKGLAELWARWRESGGSPVLWSVMGMSAFAGVWIGSMLRHAGLVRSWAVIGGLVLGISQVVALVRYLWDAPVRPSGAAAWGDAFGGGVIAIIAAGLVALAIPLGGGVALLIAEVRKLWYQMLVRRARRRRQR